MPSQKNNKHPEKRVARRQAWLLPVSFMLAIPLALLILKPKLEMTYESSGNGQISQENVESTASEDLEKKTSVISKTTELTGNEEKGISKMPRFVKLSADGFEASNDSQWSCVYDRVNHLIWEVKRDDGSWRDKEFTFSWYAKPEESEGGGIKASASEPVNLSLQGKADGGDCIYINCDTASYIAQINSEQICAISNWRLPHDAELRSLDHPSYFNPDIDTDFFPHTMPGLYWSGSESAKNRSLALAVDFNNNIGYAKEKRSAHYVRAVADAN